MPGMFDKLKAALSGKKDKKVEAKDTKPADGEVHILPVPGNTNYPPQTGGSSNLNPEWEAHKGLGPVIPDAQALGEPKTREELRARSAELNSS